MNKNSFSHEDNLQARRQPTGEKQTASQTASREDNLTDSFFQEKTTFTDFCKKRLNDFSNVERYIR